MVPEKLMAYLKSQKSKGYPDEMIKAQFVQKGWPIAVLDEAYLQMADRPETKSADAEALSNIMVVSEPSVATEPTTAQPIIEQSQLPELPKKWLVSVTVMFILMSQHYGTHASAVLLLMMTIQSSMNQAGLSTSILTSYPTIFVAMIMTLGVGIYYFFLAFRARTFSEKTWKLSTMSLLCIPFVYYPLLNLLLMPLLGQVALMNKTPVTYILPGADLMWSLALGYIFWKTKKLHVYPDTGVSRKMRIWMALVIIINIVILVTAGYVMSKNSSMGDLDYANISAQVNHRIYKPDTLPDELAYAMKYEIREEAGAQVVRLGLGTPINKMSEGQSKVVVITQKAWVEGHKMESEYVGYTTELELVTIPLAIDQTGYYGQKPFGDGFMSNLTFVTEDKVVVSILAPNVELPLLLDLAGRLK